jgi:murein DD-endopeptidase MepM/ murein hydrolase activator NlpD
MLKHIMAHIDNLQRLPLAFMLALALGGCAASPPLWGTYQTPTAETAGLVSPEPASEVVSGGLEPLSPSAIPVTPPPNPTSATSTPRPASLAGPATITPTLAGVPFLYYAQSGDTLPSLANRFGVDPAEITSSSVLPATGLIDPGTLVVVPNRIEGPTTPNIQIMPDNEVIFAATGLDFDVAEYVEAQNGYLASYRDYPGSIGWLDGSEVVERLALENSINPRLLLGILEYESRWVRGQPVDLLHSEYPMGFQDFRYKGMYIQMAWAINQVSNGYYGWRAGTLTELGFADGTRLRLDPRLNAGSVAIQFLFSRLHSQTQWAQIINPETGFPTMYTEMFGDPWVRADLVDPILPPDLSQPVMTLPFEPGVEWSYTGGPHNAWGKYRETDVGSNDSNSQLHGGLAAVDFAPSTDHGGCEETPTWVLASSPGLIVRAANGVVMVDADGDGFEQTGWNTMYLHVATKDRVKAGTWIENNGRIGHASCEGGISTGTHLHFARKYNGEWIAADGPVPFVLSGWRVVAGQKPYEGELMRGDQIVTADPVGQKWSNIFRDTIVNEANTGLGD